MTRIEKPFEASMTKLELLEKLDREATGGPWNYTKAYGVSYIENNDRINIASIVEDVSDADLICEMRNALPDLLAVVIEAKRACAMYRSMGDTQLAAIRVVCMEKALAKLEETK